MSGLLYQNTVQKIIELSREYSTYVNETVVTVQSLEMAYHEIESAISKTHDDIEVDNVVRRGLMQSIARRDMRILLAKTITMEKLLATSIELLIQNGEAAIRLTHCDEDLESHTAAEVNVAKNELNIAKNELVANLNVLKGLVINMLANARSIP